MKIKHAFVMALAIDKLISEILVGRTLLKRLTILKEFPL